MASIYYDTFLLKNVKAHYVQLRIEKVDIYSEKSRMIFEKTIPIPLFLFFLILCVPFLIIFMLWTSFSFIGYYYFNKVTEPSYEQAQKWFENKKGYFANIPETEKDRLMKKSENS
jgi:predicted membrane protein